MSNPSGSDANRDPAAPTATEGDRPSENSAPARGNETGAWQAPWVASPEHPEGATNAPLPPQQATGHYGAGYDDPTPHFGNTLPGRPDVDAPGEGGGGEALREREAPQRAHQPTDDSARKPDFTPDEVGFRPPDRAPSEEAPASENAGLIFERS